MTQINYSRDPRLKPAPVVVLVDSDDEDKAPVPRKSVASDEVINIDSQSDNDDGGASSTPGKLHRPKEEAELGGDINTDAYHGDHKDREEQEDTKMDESDNFGGDVMLDDDFGEDVMLDDNFGEDVMLDDDFDEDMMPDGDDEGREQEYEYEADYLLGGSMEVYILQVKWVTWHTCSRRLTFLPEFHFT